MTEAEIKAGLLSIEPQHPFVQALNALMDAAVNDEQDAVTNPNLTDGARHFNAGRLAHAKDFQNALAGIIKEAHREQAAALAQAEREKV